MLELLLVSVGGSPAPVIYSINSQKPERIIFFASHDSYNLVHDEIRPALEYEAKRFETIVTDDEQDLLVCVETLLKGLPRILKLWKMDCDAVTADYTGGTKTMSAAVVLALASHIRNFSYVGGTRRDKEGLGVVINGREQMLYLKNPWDVLAVEILNDMALMFNRCRFQTVIDLAGRAMSQARDKKPAFEALRVIAEAFYLWDNFHYDKALGQLKRGVSELAKVCAAGGGEYLNRFRIAVEDNLRTLEAVADDFNAFAKSSPKARRGNADSPEPDGSALLLDLLGNAVRRAELEHKYDDAVARLYSAIEKMAKIRLKAGHGIDNSAVDPEKIPEPVRDDYRADEGGRPLQLPLHRSFELLSDLGDQLGAAYRERQDELGKVLTTRNNSLMAHGFDPVSQPTYETLLRIALDFMGMATGELPRFPVMEWGKSGL